MRYIAPLFALFLIVSVNAQAGPYSNFANSIPKTNERGAAKDLFLPGQELSEKNLSCLRGRFPSEGRVISKDEAECLEGIDLSKLNPGSQSVWNKRGDYSTPFYQDIPTINAEDGDTFEYLSSELSGLRNSKHFIRSAKNGQHYRLKISKYVHNVLLRAALLERLGYYIMPVKHFKKLKIKFSRENSDKQNEIEMIKFIKTLRSDVSGAPDRWITNIKKQTKKPPESDIKRLMKLGLTEEEAIEKLIARMDGSETEWVVDPDSSAEKNTLELQDVIIYLEKDYVTDVAAGFYDAPYVAQRRFLNSLLVPYSLTDVPESLNKFSWDGCAIINNAVSLPYSNDPSGQLTPNWDDAKWITRKILELNEEDWWKVAQAANYPKVDGGDPVTKLAYEKLKSRRNCIRELILPDEKEYKPLPVTMKVSDKKSRRLHKGILSRYPVGDKRNDEEHPPWEGYGSRFSIGSQDSPLSLSEIFAWGRSLIYSNAIRNLVQRANDELALNSKEKNNEDALANQQEQSYERLLNYIKTGEVQRNEFGTWSTPLYGVEFFLGHDEIIGSYLGSENNIQIADTFGYSINLGMLWGLNGIPEKVLSSVSAKSNYVVRYTHIRPINSFKKAAKEYGELKTYKNMVVNWYANSTADILGEILDENHLSTEVLKLSDNAALKELAEEKQKIEQVAQRICESYVDDQIRQEQESEDMIDSAVNMARNLVSDEDERRQERIADCEREKERAIEQLEEFVAQYDEKMKKLVSDNYQELKREKINLILQEFHANFGVGESLIITKSLGGSLGINASYAIDVRNQFRAKFEKGLKTISRIHILKKTETAIQVYKNNALVHTYDTGFSWEKYFFPILRINFSGINTFGKPDKNQTRFFEFSLPESLTMNEKSDGYVDESGGIGNIENDKVDDNEIADIEAKARVIQALFKHQDTELLEDMQDPITVQHSIDSDDGMGGLLWMTRLNKQFSDIITVINPKVPFEEFNTAQYVRGSSGSRTGNDYQSLVTDGLAAYFDYNEIDNITFDVTTSNNPGDTFKGNSYFSRATFDARIPRDITKGSIEKPLVDLTFRWKGWDITRQEADDLIDIINRRFGFDLDLNKKLNKGNPVNATLSDPLTTGWVYSPNTFFDTEIIQLYRIDVNVFIYDEGVSHILGIPSFNDMGRHISDAEFKQYLTDHGEFPLSGLPKVPKRKSWAGGLYDERPDQIKKLIEGQTKVRAKIRSYIEEGNYEKLAVALPAFIESISHYLNITELTHLAGGSSNIFVRSTIDGYKKNSENEDKTIYGFTLNKIGDLDRKGQLASLITDLKVDENSMAENEFFMIWLLGQL